MSKLPQAVPGSQADDKCQGQSDAIQKPSDEPAPPPRVRSKPQGARDPDIILCGTLVGPESVSHLGDGCSSYLDSDGTSF